MKTKLAQHLKPFSTLPGEHAFTFQGKVGQLEAFCVNPDHQITPYMAILGHPHSLQGGTFSNKVITTLARTFAAVGISSIRFNFRGVGASEGEYDAGIGESEDLLILMQQVIEAMPDTQFILAGFSFGSYVVYRAALEYAPKLLLSIAPPVHHYDYTVKPTHAYPWVIVQGEADEVVDANLVFQFAARQSPPVKVIRFPETGHFFHGKLLLLRETITQILHETGIIA